MNCHWFSLKKKAILLPVIHVTVTLTKWLCSGRILFIYYYHHNYSMCALGLPDQMITSCGDYLLWCYQLMASNCDKYNNQEIQNTRFKKATIQTSRLTVTFRQSNCKWNKGLVYSTTSCKSVETPWEKSVFNGDKEICRKSCPHYSKYCCSQCLMHDISWLETLQWGGGGWGYYI